MLGRRGAYREAQEQSRRALQVNGHDPMIHRNLAKIENQLGDVHTALHHNLKAIQMESKLAPDQRSTKSYRQAAVQIISTGGDRAEAHRLMDAARALEKRKFVLPTTERTNQVLQMMLERRGNALGDLEREQEKRDQIIRDREEALKGGDINVLLSKIKKAADERKKLLEENA